MRAVVFPRPDEYELTEVPDPASSPDEVIVSVKAKRPLSVRRMSESCTI
jgi:NADPH:quinone reductase-like Zn-dependent oxidoreductase